MKTYSNDNGITRMRFLDVPVTVFCPLGPNYYRASVSCEIELNDTITDFLDLEAYFKQELNGKHLTSEQLCDEVFQKLTSVYEPEHLRVVVRSDSHFPIETIKES